MTGHRVCPWWIGYLLLSPLRKLAQNPRRILDPFVRPGMTVLDVGSAMGFFSLPLARLVGPRGRVVCVDLQPRMIRALRRRARRAGLEDRIVGHVCREDDLGLQALREQVDFALAFAVLHEMPDVGAAGGQILAALRSGGRLLVAEPAGHVSEAEFDRTVTSLQRAGFVSSGRPVVARSRTLLLQKSLSSTTR